MYHLIKDTEFKIFFKVLTQNKGLYTKKIKKVRVFFEALAHMLKTGCQWRILPEKYGHYRAIHKRFFKWVKKGIWEKIFQEVQQEPDMEYAMIDSTIVRAHACAAGYGKNSQDKQALGRSRGGFSTKIHAITDALGNPLKFILTPGESSDINQAEKLVEGIQGILLLADKGYDADKLFNLNFC